MIKPSPSNPDDQTLMIKVRLAVFSFSIGQNRRLIFAHKNAKIEENFLASTYDSE